MTAGAMLLIAVAWLGACQATPQVRVAEARSAFDAGDFERAYQRAAPVARSRDDALGLEAAYVAGMSAYRLRRLGSAAQYLRMAVGGEEAAAGNAMAMLGLVYIDQGRYDRASRLLLAAAERVRGQNRANAYFYAAAAEHQLERWANARAYLTLARSISTDEAFRQRAAEQLRQTGWTIQLGRFDDAAAARAAADRLAANPHLADVSTPTVATIVKVDGRPEYVVRCGEFSAFATAAAKRRLIGVDEAVITVVPLP